MHRIPKERLGDFLDYLAKDAELIIPVKRDGLSFFKGYEKGDRPYLGKGNTDYSAKGFFFPNREVIYSYDSKGEFSKNAEAKGRVIFGIRPCDLHAIAVTDMFFSEDPADPFYLEKRGRSVLIAVDCITPGKNCFCDSLGKRDAIGHDALLFEHGKFYYIRIATQKGSKAIEGFPHLEKTDESPEPKKVQCKKKANPVDASKVKWEKWGAKCFACTSCTSVCPTCTCFDIEDEKRFDGKTERQRIWASCFTKDFTTVAGGHCFRPERSEMLRQFVSHKFPYFKEKFGVAMCVGCGRCITVCTAEIDISKMISGK